MRKTDGRLDGLITSLKIDGAPQTDMGKKHAAQSIDKDLFAAGTAKFGAS